MIERPIIVITGFMASGKTTMSKLLADKYNISYIDTDSYIENYVNLSISEIFKVHGEAYFRELEHRAVKHLLNETRHIISLGGGTILNPNNYYLLANANCLIIYLKRDFKLIYPLISEDSGRPLSYNTDKKVLADMYNKRNHIYNRLSDVVIENNSTISDCVDKFDKLLSHYHYSWTNTSK